MPYPILAERYTWYTQGNTTTEPSSFTKIKIVDSYEHTGLESESWDASASKDGSIMVYTNGKTLTIAGNGSGKIALSQDASNTFKINSKTFSSVTEIDGLELFDVSNVTNMTSMFEGCRSVTNFSGLSDWNVINVTNTKKMFYRCMAVTNFDCLSGWEVDNVINMYGMFENCRSVTNFDCLSDWNVNNVTNMSYMFHYCSGTTSFDGLSDWKVINVTNMSYMFAYCLSLESIDFISNWEFLNLKTIDCMFFHCESLTSINIPKLKFYKTLDNGTYLMFAGCKNLISVNSTEWDLSNVTSTLGMFSGCSSLAELDVEGWKVGNVTTMKEMFSGCVSLQSLKVDGWNVKKVTNFSGMFGSGSSEIQMLIEINTSGWETESATDMSFMFYGCRKAQPDVSNWDVSKVKNFDHMFAHSYMKAVDVSKWDTSSATNMYCMFHSIQSEVIDVSSFDTSNVITFGYMFKRCDKLTKIIGLENFDTSKGVDFSQMFYDCNNLKELNLSSFDTTKAKDGISVSDNGSTSLTMSNMFTNMYKLSKITLGTNFSFNGDGTTTKNIAVIPIPSSEYIRRANGKWYNESGDIIDKIPDKIAGTYYAEPPIYRDYVRISKGSLEDIADSIRAAKKETNKYCPEDMSTAISQLNTDYFWDIFQNNGTKKSYRMAFFNWKGEIYQPKYPVTTVSQNSQAYYYYQGKDTKVPITVSGGTSQFFTSAKFLISIPLLDVDETTDLCDASNRTSYHIFGSCSSLENLTLSGTIGKNMWIPESPLTRESMIGNAITDDKLAVGEILQTSYANFGFRIDSYTTNDTGEITSVRTTPVQSEDQYATYPISKLDELSLTFNLVKLGDTYYWGGIFGALKDYSGSGITHTLTIGTTEQINEEDVEVGNLLKLEPSEKAIATEKGWTLASWKKQ